MYPSATVALAAVLAAGGATYGAVQSEVSTNMRTCTLDDLYLSMGAKEGAAGSVYWPIQITNTSTSRCALRGYPGVSVLSATHQQIGSAASRAGRPFNTVAVAPGKTVTAVVRTTNGPVGGPCRPTGTYLRVYPPASYKAELIPAPMRVCSNLFEVGPVTTQATS